VAEALATRPKWQRLMPLVRRGPWARLGKAGNLV
jgi:hypothetical protein